MKQASETKENRHIVASESSNRPSTAEPPSDARSSSGSSQWKDAVIVGSMVGFSLLFAALVLIEKLPNAIPRSVVGIPDSDSVAGTHQLTQVNSKPVDNPPANRTNAIIGGDADSQTIRSGPGTNYGVTHEVYLGDRAIIRGASTALDGYTWYKIYIPTSDAEGWIASQLLQLH